MILSLAAFLLLVCPVAAYAQAQNGSQTGISKIAKQLSPDIFKEVSQIPPKPHYLLGLNPKNDAWERYLEAVKVFQTKDLFYGKNGFGIIDKSSPDYHFSSNTEILESVNIEGKNIRIVYTHHHLAKDGIYTFWSRMGEKNLAEFSPFYRKYEVRWAIGQIKESEWLDIQRVLGWAQFEAVKEQVHGVIRGALSKDIKDYSEMNLTQKVLEARAALLDDPRYADHLDDPVPGWPNLKVRDTIPVPLTRPQDFLPDLLVVGPKGFYGGFANFKTPDTERIVFLDLSGLALSYVKKNYNIAAHEFVHTNPYLQGVPLSLYYDIEMWADLTTSLDGDILWYLWHPYQAVVRDMAKDFFGYDFKEAMQKIWPGEFGVRDIREKEFRQHAEQIKKITNEFLSFVKDPDNGFMVKFYEDPYYWITINTKLCDTSAAFRILFALRYEAAGIFDPDRKDKTGNVIPPVQQTKEWLTREEDAGRIKELAKKAMEKTGSITKFGEEVSSKSKAEDLSGMMKCPVNARDFLMTSAERQRFIEIVKPLIEQAKRGDIEARVVLLRIFGPNILIRSPR